MAWYNLSAVGDKLVSRVVFNYADALAVYPDDDGSVAGITSGLLFSSSLDDPEILGTTSRWGIMLNPEKMRVINNSVQIEYGQDGSLYEDGTYGDCVQIAGGMMRINWSKPVYFWGFLNIKEYMNSGQYMNRGNLGVAAALDELIMCYVDEPKEPTITENLERIITAKEKIRVAIEGKGVTVDVNEKIDTYSSYIDAIEIGGGGGDEPDDKKIVLPNGLTFSGSTFTEFDGSNYMMKQIYDCASLFEECGNLVSVTNIHLYPKSCKRMFYNCLNLETVDTTGWTDQDYTDFNSMFYNCKKLSSIIDLSNWDTGNVVDMHEMFYYCEKLTSLNLNNWCTSNVTDMSGMFAFCKGLTSLDVNSWDTSYVSDMNHMFSSCHNLLSLDVNNWDTSNVIKMSSTFYECRSLTSLDVNNWDTSNVTTMDSIFRYCSGLTSLDLSNWDTSNVTVMSYMFNNCTNLSSLSVANWKTSKVTKMDNMFRFCSNLKTIDLSNWDMSNVTTMGYMFGNCTNLTEVKMGGDISKLITVSTMFNNVKTNGTLYYPAQYDYSKIINVLPSTWTAVPY